MPGELDGGAPREAGRPITPDPRITWAAERTFLAWIRTGIALMGFGFVVARFGLFLRELALAGSAVEAPRVNATYVGVAMVGFGVLINVASTLRYRRTIAALRRGEPIVPELRFPASVALGSALVGAALVALLARAFFQP